MKLGNIVTTTKVGTPSYFNVVDDIKDINQDLPTLVVGYELMMVIFPDMDSTNKIYNKKISWTCTINENRRTHLIDIEEFIQRSLDELVSVVKYVSVDSIHTTRATFKKIYNKIMGAPKLYSYIHNDRIIYIVVENIIFGIDLELYKYLGINPEKLKSKIKAIPNNTLLSSEILIEYKEYVDRLHDDVKYIPYLYSMNNE